MGLEGEAGLHLIREAIEGVVAPKMAAAILFDALELEGSDSLPSSKDALLAFVLGSLRAVVIRRLGTAEASEVVQRIKKTVETVSEAGDGGRVSSVATLEIEVGTGPVRVLVLSKTTSMAVRLRAALGGFQIQVASASDTGAARTVGKRLDPEIIVIDADAPISDADGVMLFIETLPMTSTSVLWGEDQTFGRTLKHEAVQRRVKLTTVDRSEGVDPVLDLIRSRHA
jgi:hypothetical protein